MNAQTILNTVLSLAQNNGTYGRIYNVLCENDEALNYLESQNFADPVDLILFLES